MLALSLGMTVKRLLQEIDSAELTRWMAFYRRHPFFEFRNDNSGSKGFESMDPETAKRIMRAKVEQHNALLRARR